MVVLLLLVIVAILLVGRRAVLGVAATLGALMIAFVIFAFVYSDPWGSLKVVGTLAATGPVIFLTMLLNAYWQLQREEREKQWPRLERPSKAARLGRARVRGLIEESHELFRLPAPNRAEKKVMRQRLKSLPGNGTQMSDADVEALRTDFHRMRPPL